jgi:hypothetical protein
MHEAMPESSHGQAEKIQNVQLLRIQVAEAMPQ